MLKYFDTRVNLHPDGESQHLTTNTSAVVLWCSTRRGLSYSTHPLSPYHDAISVFCKPVATETKMLDEKMKDPSDLQK